MACLVDKHTQAEELHEYMKDLFGWQKEMKAKEKGLAKQAGPGSSSAPLPPVRGRAAGGAPPAAVAAPPTAPAVRPAPEPSATSPERGAEAELPGGQARHPAAHTYDHYRDKWDRFDVDAALASEEEEGRGAAASSDGGGRQTAAAMAAAAAPPAQQQLLQQPAGGGRPGAAPLPAARLRTAAQAAAARPPQPTTADGWREEGNRHFKAGAFQQAADCYTASLALAPTCLAHANRAMALLKMGRQAEAEADCTAALGLDPSYVKAYQRRWGPGRRARGSFVAHMLAQQPVRGQSGEAGSVWKFVCGVLLRLASCLPCDTKQDCAEAAKQGRALHWDSQVCTVLCGWWPEAPLAAPTH